MLNEQKPMYYIATVSYMLHDSLLCSDVLIVTESSHKAFNTIESNDHMKVIREETYPDNAKLIEGKHNKYFGINEYGDAVYEDTFHVECKVDDNTESSYCWVIYQITKKELA